jgi:hypothetical protein
VGKLTNCQLLPCLISSSHPWSILSSLFHPFCQFAAIETHVTTNNIQPSTMDPSQVNIPPMKDLTTENITENVIQINSLCEDARMKYVLERLVHHLHDFALETRLSSNEWITGLNFLKEVGQISSDVRQVCKSAGLWLFS